MEKSANRDTDIDPDDVVRLANEFLKVLRTYMSDIQWQEMQRLNANEHNLNVCHSHDFLDSNMVMAEAWEKTFGTELDPDDEDQAYLWGEARRGNMLFHMGTSTASGFRALLSRPVVAGPREEPNMAKRFKDAIGIWEGGASNELAVSVALTSAIREVREEGKGVKEDPACKLIADQLCQLLGLPNPLFASNLIDVSRLSEECRNNS